MLETELAVTVGNGVTFSFSVVNAGDTPVMFTFRDACHVDFVVHADEHEVWRYSEAKSFAQVLSKAEFQPGEAATFDATWPDPKPGDYTAEAVLRVTEESVAARTPFSV